MATLTTLKQGLEKNLRNISSAFFNLESNNEKNAKEAPVEDVAQKAIKEALPKNQVGLLVTDALEKAMDDCRKKVETIAKRCRMTNRKFRDIEFDLEKNQYFCRTGLEGGPYKKFAVKRVTEIFKTPVFFGAHGPHASDVRQGVLGDCWFLAALSAISTIDGLLDKICVARDEEVGVYGFVFFRECVWKSVIIDDFLLWSMPKYDELSSSQQALYHNERDTYHDVVEKSGKGLLYARSGNVGETWVPLIEKAYAKLHGDYAALEGGFPSEGIEDLTGGVATSFQTSDLLSSDKFWNDELQHADKQTRLFGPSLDLDTNRNSLGDDARVQGLVPGHAYSVMRARDCRGKRFVVVRNPWGESEWTGAWSDGAKEWKGEWLDALKELEHEFGDDGQFVMEYSDFLAVFNQIDRATLFDSSWVMSSYWLRVAPQPALHPWTYGDVYYYFKLDKASATVIVLSQLDERYFKNLHGPNAMWYLDFVVYKRDSDELVGISGIGLGSQRSVSCELNLEAGEYVVLPRMEPMDRGFMGEQFWSRYKLSRALTERAESRLLAANYEVWKEIKNIPITPEVALQVDAKYAEMRRIKEEKAKEEKAKTEAERLKDDKERDDKATKEPSAEADAGVDVTSFESEVKESDNAEAPRSDAIATEKKAIEPFDPNAAGRTNVLASKPNEETPAQDNDNDSTGSSSIGDEDEDDPERCIQAADIALTEGPPTQPLFLGLRVYTRDGAVATVSGRLKEIIDEEE